MSRLKWLLLPLFVAIWWRIVLYGHWLQDREEWILKNNGDSGAVAWGDGRLDAQAIILTQGTFFLALTMCLFLPEPKVWRIFLVSIFAVTFAYSVEANCGEAIYKYIGAAARFYAPTIVGALLVIGAFSIADRVQRKRSPHAA